MQDDPQYDQPHYYMGVIYRLRKDLRSATVEFEKAIELNPKNARAFGNLAFVFVDLGKLERAERCMRRAIELDPTDQLSKDALNQIQELRKRSKSAG